MEPKLLTEAEWQRISSPLGLTSTIDQIASALRERGLIAPDPDAIDRLRDALEAIHGIALDRDKMARVCRKARMELRPPLTREMVREAIIKADPCCLAKSDFRPTSQHLKGAEAFVDALHAALTDAKGGE